MIFKQLLDPASKTYTYLISCKKTGATVLIDPVLESLPLYQQVLEQIGLTLGYTLETHVHADHLTAAWELKQRYGSKIVFPKMQQLLCADILVQEGQPLLVGEIEIKPLFTPGHTDHHHAYLVDNGTQLMLFTGDALLIDGCGRTDFQSGDAATLYNSIHTKLFSLPDETLVYPGHDYDGRYVSSIAQEKAHNARLGNQKSVEEFIAIMSALDIPKPKNMHFAVPGNMQCGIYRPTAVEYPNPPYPDNK